MFQVEYGRGDGGCDDIIEHRHTTRSANMLWACLASLALAFVRLALQKQAEHESVHVVLLSIFVFFCRFYLILQARL